MAETAVFLKALTPEAKIALGGGILKITGFPFRVGRESRRLNRGENLHNPLTNTHSVSNNDLYLLDLGEAFNVSREHFLIDYQDGMYVLIDRGSSCGTLVEGETVGEKKKGGWKRLNNNDVIIVGTSESRFIFKFLLLDSL